MDRNNGNGAITEAPVVIIWPPPDRCSQDDTQAGAHYSKARSNGEIVGWYHCPTCHFIWDTTWRIEPVTPSREG